MSFTNRFEADISPKKTRIDAKAYQQYIDIPIGQNPETGKQYTFRAYIAVAKMQKKLNYKPTTLITLTFFKYKLHRFRYLLSHHSQGVYQVFIGHLSSSHTQR